MPGAASSGDQAGYFSRIEAHVDFLRLALCEPALLFDPQRSPVRMGVEVLPAVQQTAEGVQGDPAIAAAEGLNGQLPLLFDIELGRGEGAVVKVDLRVADQLGQPVLRQVGADDQRQAARLKSIAQRLAGDANVGRGVHSSLSYTR